MISVKNLVKKYQTKKKDDVVAVNSVSIDFPETGIVFLLGKSGCGKSTLLNVIGGLDKPTDGEIIVNGKSSKDFSDEDFDNYRNTYVGFIFQEYNIIEELSVNDNVALALRLQNKKATSVLVEEALKKVELDGLADRKPNELSGGQRQRVALARALIKNPYLILADEPTGALDSQTGENIFKLLKELSKDRLIIVASHDQEFAKRYADRIIEIKDGSILKDTVINKSQNNALATSETKLRKSKLPMGTALRMGCSNFAKKKVKLVFSIILSSVALVLLGVASSCVLFDKSHALSETLKKANYLAPKLFKQGKYSTETYVFNQYGDQYYNTNNGFKAIEDLYFTQDDISMFKEKGVDLAGIFHFQGRSGADFQYLSYDEAKRRYYRAPYYDLEGLSDSKDYFENHMTLLEGRYPENDSEILLSNFKVNCLLETIDSETGEKKFSSKEDLLNSTLIIDDDYQNRLNLKIVGIFDAGEIPNKEKYEALKSFPGNRDEKLVAEWSVLNEQSFLNIGFVSEDFFEKHIKVTDEADRAATFLNVDNPIDYSVSLEPTLLSAERTFTNQLFYFFSTTAYEMSKDDFNVYDLDGNIMENINLKKNEIIAGDAVLSDFIQHDASALLDEYRFFSGALYDGIGANDLIKEYRDLPGDYDFTYYVEKLRYGQYDWIREDDLEELKEAIDYVSPYIDRYFDEYSRRVKILLTLKNNTYSNDSEDIYKQFLLKSWQANASSDDLTRLKTLYDRIPTYESKYFYDYEESEWNFLEDLFKNNYKKTGGYYNALVLFAQLLDNPYSIELPSELRNRFYLLSNGINGLSDFENKLANDEFDSNFYENIYNFMCSCYEGTKDETKNTFLPYVQRFKRPDYTLKTEDSEIKIVGRIEHKNGEYIGHGALCSSEFFKNYKINIDESTTLTVYNHEYKRDGKGKYSYLKCKPYHSKKALSIISSKHNTFETRFCDEATMTVYDVASGYTTYTTIFNSLAGAFALFAALLLMNFISDSVNNKEKEIGILRSLGARKTDLVKIFLTEACVIGVIAAVIAIVGSAFAVFGINFLVNYQGLASLFEFTILNGSIVFIFGIIVACVSSIIPLVRICKKSPVDAVKSL